MYFKPHKLYKKVFTPSERDENGDLIPGTGGEQEVYLCDCFLHDVTVQIKAAYAGMSINPTHYINLDRRDDLNIDNEVIVKEGDIIRGQGKIVDVKRLTALNYTQIYI